MSDQLQDQAPDTVQSSTIKPLKKAKNQFSKYKETISRGSRLPNLTANGPIYEFAERYNGMLKVLPKVKTANQPKYNSMFSRKFMILIYLVQIERNQGFFSVFSIQEHFRQTKSGYADHYFSQLIAEGWAIAVDTHLPKHRHAILSPLFHGLVDTVTNTLRRKYPERFKSHDIAVLSPEIQAIQPNESMLDYIQEITDPR